MNVPISIEKKRAFLNWFMHHHKVKAHDMDWFLKDLFEDEQALSHLHFVDDITDCPKGIIITSHLNDQITFRFFKGSVQTEDVYTAYHEMNLYQNEPIFIQMTFPFCSHNKFYQDVIEDDTQTQREIKTTTEELLNKMLQQGRDTFLKKEINLALENRDYDKFMYYSSQLKALKE